MHLVSRVCTNQRQENINTIIQGKSRKWWHSNGINGLLFVSKHINLTTTNLINHVIIVIHCELAALNIFHNGQHIRETLKSGWFTCRYPFVFWGKWLISSDWRHLQSEQRAKHRDKVGEALPIVLCFGMTRHLPHWQQTAGHNVPPCAATYWGGDSAAAGRPTSYEACQSRDTQICAQSGGSTRLQGGDAGPPRADPNR